MIITVIILIITVIIIIPDCSPSSIQDLYPFYYYLDRCPVLFLSSDCKCTSLDGFFYRSLWISSADHVFGSYLELLVSHGINERINAAVH